MVVGLFLVSSFFIIFSSELESVWTLALVQFGFNLMSLLTSILEISLKILSLFFFFAPTVAVLFVPLFGWFRVQRSTPISSLKAANRTSFNPSLEPLVLTPASLVGPALTPP